MVFLASDTKRERPCVKFVWVFVVLSSIGAAIVFLIQAVTEFKHSTVQTTILTTTTDVDQIYFPAVTICNLNLIRRSVLRRLGVQHNSLLRRKIITLGYQGDSKKNLSGQSQEDAIRVFRDTLIVQGGRLAKTLMQTTPPCMPNTTQPLVDNAVPKPHASMRKVANDSFLIDSGAYFRVAALNDIVGISPILRATYKGQSKDGDTFAFLSQMISTDQSLCTTIKAQVHFNPSYDNVSAHDALHRAAQKIPLGLQLGKDQGIDLILDAEIYDYGFLLERGEGFKIAVHHPRDLPLMQLSSNVLSPGFVTLMTVRPALSETSSEALVTFGPLQRGCYLDSEFPLLHVSPTIRYSMNNCRLNAVIGDIGAKCQCMPFWHDSSQDFEAVDNKVCRGKQLKCMNRIIERAGLYTHSYANEPVEGVTRQQLDQDPKQRRTHGWYQKRICLPACQDQSFEVSSSMSSIGSDVNLFAQSPFYCVLFRRLLHVCTNSSRVEILNQKYSQDGVVFCAEVTKVLRYIHDDPIHMNCFQDMSFGDNQMCRHRYRGVLGQEANTNGLSQFDQHHARRRTLAEEHEDYSYDGWKMQSLPTLFYDQLEDEQVSQNNNNQLTNRMHISPGSSHAMVNYSFLNRQMYRYAKENLAVARVYVQHPEIITYRRDVKQPLIWFIASLGGILGLAMGASLVTIMEVAYFFGIPILRNIKNRLLFSS